MDRLVFQNATERLIFRALEPEDLDWLAGCENNPSHWTEGDRLLPISKAAFKTYIENASESIQEAGQFRWVIEDKSTGLPVGLLDLFDYSERHQRAAVGIYIQDADREKGFAKEAILWLIQYATEVAFLHQLYAHIAVTNTRSLALFTQCGFEQCALLSDWLRRGKTFVDVAMMQVHV